MGRDKTRPFSDRSDDELLQEILNSEASLDVKAQAVLSVRERAVASRQNKLLLWLSLVASLATAIQAIPVISEALRGWGERSGKVAPCAVPVKATQAPDESVQAPPRATSVP